jgi:hypothetical protein
MNYFKFTVGLVVAVMLSGSAPQRGERPSQLQHSTRSSSIPGVITATLMNVNEMSGWYSNTGEQERNPRTQAAGLIYPHGTSTAVYMSGLMWGGIVHDGITPALRVNGYEYNSGTKPGIILGLRTGITEDPASPDARIWRVRRDFATADLKRDAAEFFGVLADSVTAEMESTVRGQYALDWVQWPWQKGAPFYDVNHNGMRDADEEPGIAGADQVIWYACNDIGVGMPPWLSPEIGLEQQVTIWAYSRSGALANTIFKSFRLIYKGTASSSADAHIDSMYIQNNADTDLGDGLDDLAGCDTLLHLGYTYNGNPVDAFFSLYSLTPPAFGYTLLQGPIVSTGNPSDTAVFKFQRIARMKNLGMTASIYFAGNGPYYDPPFSYGGAIQWYQAMRGLPPYPQGPPDPLPLNNPTTGQPTSFWVSGDPVGATGWLDGTGIPPSDRRIAFSSGPFSMVIGDTQEVLIAAVGGLGSSNIASVSVLRTNVTGSRDFYRTLPDSTFSRTSPFPGPQIAVLPSTHDFGSQEVGLVSMDTLAVEVVNYGSDTLNVTSLDGLSPSFSLAQPISFPLSIPPIATGMVKVLFHPVVGGTVRDTMRFQSNDPAATMATTIVSGKGFVVGMAEPGIIYLQEFESLYAIDLSVPGVIPAGSLPPGLSLKLTIRPTTHELYGVGGTPPSIYRVSPTGDLTFVRSFGIEGLNAIAFSDDDSLYGVAGSRLYRLNTSNGDTLFIGAASGFTYGSIAFNPTTGALWGSAKYSPPAANTNLYKVNTLTGAATVVGSSGRRNQRQIAFDSQGRLFVLARDSICILDTVTLKPTYAFNTGHLNANTFAFWGDVPVSVGKEPHDWLPDRYELGQNYPNPFNPSTTITYQLPRTGHVTIRVYSTLGQDVLVLVNEDKQAGRHTIRFDGTLLPSGVYFVQLSSGGFVQTRKMVLLR